MIGCRPFWSSVASAILLLVVVPVRAIVTDAYDVQLPAGSLHQAFIALGQQTQSSIIFPSSIDDVQDIAEISGRYSIVEVLDQLTDGRDIEFRVVGPLTVVVLPRCIEARDCQSLQQDSTLNIQQYPMIEELIVRGEQVTGSRFKQIDGNSFTPVEIITSTEIRLSGVQTLSQLMRFTPEVAGNSASTSVSNGGNGTASVTLRGLPSTNTLVLVNGLRTTSNAVDGGSVDLNSIPLAAVDRVEILKDSGSSIYGSDAIAGVVNVILRKNFDGILLNSFYGASAEGDNQTRRYDLLAGGRLGNVELMAVASHYNQAGFFSRDRAISRSADGRDFGGLDQRSSATPNARILLQDSVVSLTSDQLDGTSVEHFSAVTNEHLFDYRAYTSSLIPAQRDSFYLSGSLLGLDSLDSAFELSYVKNSTLITYAPMPVFTAFEEIPITVSAANQFNPFSQDIEDLRVRLTGLGPRLQENQSQTLRASAALTGAFNQGEWQASVNWSRNNAVEQWRNLVDLQHITLALGDSSICAITAGCVPINVFAGPGAIAANQLDYIRANATNRGRSMLSSFNFDLSQTLDLLPAGEVELAAGIELRRETLVTQADQRVESDQLIGGEYGSSRGKRTISELYVESLIPLIGGANAGNRLEANFSLRSTHFSDFGAQTNPKLALRYRPSKDLTLRGSISRGFRAPSLFELNQSDSVSQAFLLDPCSIEENIKLLPGCQLPTDPLRVQYPTVIGGNPELKPETSENISLGFIYSPASLRNVSLAMDVYRIQVDDIIGASGQFFLEQNAASQIYGERILRDQDGELVKVIANNENLGMRRLSGVDIDLAGRLFIAKWGSLGVNLSASHLASYQFQGGPTAEIRQLAATFEDEAAEGSGALPKWKTRLNVFWQFGAWEVALTSFRVSSVSETVSGLNSKRRSGAWSREDAQVSYHFNAGKSLITLGVENLLDEAPPFIASAFNDNFDSRTYDSTGRFFYARLSHHL